MAVNRESRDELASALAGYMRGEISNQTLDEVVQDLGSDDETVHHLSFMLWFLHDDFKSHPLEVTEEGWRELQRILVFLKTDLELRKVKGERVWFHRTQIEGTILLVACGVAALLFWGNARLVAACWIAIGGIWWGSLGRGRWQRSNRPEVDAGTPPSVHLATSFPFESETQWRRHENLVEAFRLPPYNPVKHSEVPIRHPAVHWIMMIPGTLLIGALAPLWGLLMLLPRRESRYVVMGAGRD